MNIGTASGAIGRDIKWATRTLVKRRGFTTVAVLSLALGIGANTAIFELVDAVRLRALPVSNPGELAEIRLVNMRSFYGSMRRGYGLTNPQWEAIRARQKSFSGVFAWSSADLNLARGGEIRRARALLVSGDYFRTLGVKPILGRTLTPGDDFHACPSSGAVISDGFWQREYASDRSILGRRLTLEGQPFEIVGVSPPGFYGVEIGSDFDVALPVCTEPLLFGESSFFERRTGWWLSAMGRLKPGVSLAQASAELSALSPGIMQDTLPDIGSGPGKQYLGYHLAAVTLSPARQLRGQFGAPLQILFAMTGAVLLIACANLANLMLARATGRQAEIALRMAVGAPRIRVLQLMFTESALVSIAGTLGGLLLAGWMSDLLVATISTRRLRLSLDLQMDWRVLGFSVLLAVVTSIAFGLLPAIRATGADPGETIKSGARSSTAARNQFGVQRAFVITQVAVSMALLAGALLFVRSFRNLIQENIGMRVDGLISVSVDFARVGLPNSRRGEFRNDVVARFRRVQGVISAALTWASPLNGSTSNGGINIDHQVKGDSYMNAVGPDFFKTVGTEILTGRDFNDLDNAGAPRVAIVNQSFARKFFPGASPIGRVFSRSGLSPKDLEKSYQIVGMVQDAKLSSIRESQTSIVYLNTGQESDIDSSIDIVVRTGAPSQTIDGIKRAIAEMNPNIDLEFKTLTNEIRDLVVAERLMAQLAGFFGGLALLLAVIGLYGVMSYMVARRRVEIGIRMALGAERGMVLKMILREAFVLVVAGLICGSVAALATGRLGESLLYGLHARDPLTLTYAAVALFTSALIAAYVPAHRAAGMDPLTSLRVE